MLVELDRLGGSRPAAPGRGPAPERPPAGMISGIIRAASSPIRAATTGKIVAVRVKDGQHVNKGDILFSLEPHDAKASPDDATLRAPFDGTIKLVDVREGTFVMQGTLLTEVVETSNLTVDMPLPLDAVERIKTGLRVAVHRWPATASNYEGEITYIAPDIDAATSTVRFRMTVRGNTEGLKSGMMVTVDLPGK